MLKQRFIIISVIPLCLIIFCALNTAAQNPVEFEITRAGMGDVFDLQVVDVDGDEVTDIVYTGLFDTDLHIMYGIKGGGYEPVIEYSEGAHSMTSAFINKDKYLDIICSDMYFVYVFINNGDRTFTINSIPHEYTNVGGVATGFFNDDSYLDIIAAYKYIYYGDGNGNFPSTLTLPEIFQTVYVSDFNNDNVDDFVTLDHNGNSTIYLNNQDGTYSPSGTFALDGLALGVSIKKPFADFNHDGNADFAFLADLSANSDSRITIGYGDGVGGVSGTEYKMISGTAYSLAIADVNRDNNLDLIASNISHNRLELFLGDSEGGFSDSYQYNFDSESYAKAMATGDLDRDGNPDFVAGGYWNDGVADESLILFINQSPDAPVLEEPMITTGFSNVGVDITNPAGFKLSRDYKTVAGADYWRQDVDLDNSIDERAIDYNLQYGEYEFAIMPNPGAAPDAKFSTVINIGQDEKIFFKDYDIPVNSKGESTPIVFYYTVEEVSSMHPANGSSIDTNMPSFDWSGMVEHVPGVSSYNFEIDRYYDFRAPLVVATNLDLPQYALDVHLSENTVYYWRFKSFDGAEWSDYSRTMAINVVDYICGNVDGLEGINILDIVFLINYKYKGGPAPKPMASGDVDGIPPVNILDIVYLINSIYKNGPDPVCK